MGGALRILLCNANETNEKNESKSFVGLNIIFYIRGGWGLEDLR